MIPTPESVVRDFLAAWSEPDRDRLARFLSDDAVWVDGPQGIRRGANEILDVLTGQLAVGGGVAPTIATLVADGGTVMVEWHGGLIINGTRIPTTVMAVFEVEDEYIKEMREAYDLQSLLDQMQAATGDASR
jgi:limonene-1,2-epoxide hydrolase